MEQSPWERNIAYFQQTINKLEEQLSLKLTRFTPFYSIFLEVFKTIDKFATSIAHLSDSIETDILTAITASEEPLAPSFQNVRNGLLGIVEAWRNVAHNSRNQVLEPLKVFQNGYRKVCVQKSAQLKKGLANCLNAGQQATRSRNAYYTCCEKLQKHKEGQTKVMMRIESGDRAELQKFNRITKTLLEKVSSSQRKYLQNVDRVNQYTSEARKFVKQQLEAFKNNELSRVQFLRKTADNQLKILELGKNADLMPRANNAEDNKAKDKEESSFEQVIGRLGKWADLTTKEKYISYQDLMKSKKLRDFEQENPTMAEQFQKIKYSQRQSLGHFAEALLEMEPGIRLVSVQRPSRDAQVIFTPEWETFLEKIPKQQHYAHYLVHIMTRILSELPKYYIKLSPPFFKNLQTLLSSLIDQLDIQAEGSKGEVSLSTAYQIFKISERVVEKQNGKIKIGGMRVLSEFLGYSKQLRSQKYLIQLVNFLVVRHRKKETKGVINFTKGLLSSLTGKRQQTTTNDEEKFNALIEFTHLMANLCLPTELTLPLLKQIFKNNESSYQYLKDILLGKRDREQRNKLVPNESTRNDTLKKILEASLSQQSIFCIKLTAKAGFFTQEDIYMRLCCKKMNLIHLDIIYRLPIALNKKWKCVSPPQEQIDVSGLKIAESVEVQQIIQLDVQRSLHIHSEIITQQKLKDFLVFYARRHKEMPYCQGMNYIAGIVLLRTSSTQDAFEVFEGVMKRLFMPVFIDNFAGMPLKLYILERLMAIFHPDLHDQLKKQMLTPQCYAVGWIITAFSSTYQYTTRSYLLDWFWERFVLWGWSQFYRLTLWLIQISRDELIGASYDKCLQVFGDLSRSGALTAESKQQFQKDFRGQLEGSFQTFAVSEELLQSLTKEFDHQ